MRVVILQPCYPLCRGWMASPTLFMSCLTLTSTLVQHRLGEEDPEYLNIPMVVADTGEVLLRLNDVEPNKTAAWRRNLKKKLTSAQNALQHFQGGHSNSGEADDDNDTSSTSSSGHGIVDDLWMDDHGEVAIAKRHAKDTRRRTRSPHLHSKDKGKGELRTKRSKRRRSSSCSASCNSNNKTSKRTRTGPPGMSSYSPEFHSVCF